MSYFVGFGTLKRNPGHSPRLGIQRVRECP